MKGADGTEWLRDFEQQLLSNPAEVIDAADQEIAELDAAITQMVRAVFDAVRSAVAEEMQDQSGAT